MRFVIQDVALCGITSWVLLAQYGVEAGDSITSTSKGLRINCMEADPLLLHYCLQPLENDCDYVCNVVMDCIRG